MPEAERRYLAAPGKRIRVLSLQSAAGVGGTELMTFSMLRRMDRERFRLRIVFLDEEGPVSSHYQREGIQPIHLRYHERPLARVVWDLFRLMRREQYDIVHLFGLRVNVIGRVVARLAGCTTVIAAQRSTDDWRKWWHIWPDRLTEQWVSMWLSNSYAGARRLAEVEGVSISKIRVIHNGIDLGSFDGLHRQCLRKELGIGGDIPIIVNVANFRPAKGHNVLIRAAQELVTNRVRFKLLLVGGGKGRASIEKQVQSAGLANTVHFLGFREDVPDILAGSDLFVLPSHWEGMPGAVMEAMAAGLPVVATDVGGLPELVIDGETGRLVPPGDSRALACAVEELLKNWELRSEMGAKGRERIRRHFLIEEKVRELEEVYIDLVNFMAAG